MVRRELAAQRQRRRQRLAAAVAFATMVVAGTVASAWGGPGPEPRRSAGAAPAAPRAGPRPVTLAFAGDVHFEGPIRERLAASPPGLLAAVAPVLRRADVAVVNLETAVTDRGDAQPKAYTFRAPAAAFDALASAGVDVASVANNHGLDYGVTGLQDTLAAARGTGVAVVGGGANDADAYAPHRVTVGGQRIAIIGATQVLDAELITAWTAGPGTPGLSSAKDEPRLLRAVREARRDSDTVVVFLHWGVELETCPSADQRLLAGSLAAAGADVIVGSHAHVLQGAGRLGNALVAYGLGNFAFYAAKELTVRSGVLTVTVTGRRIDDYGWTPARISGGVPEPLAGPARAEAVRSWHALRACTGLAA